MKLRAYELAKELNLDPKEFIVRAKAGNILIKSNLATLEDDQVAALRKLFAAQGVAADTAKKPAATKAGTAVRTTATAAAPPRPGTEAVAAPVAPGAPSVPTTTGTPAPGTPIAPVAPVAPAAMPAPGSLVQPQPTVGAGPGTVRPRETGVSGPDSSRGVPGRVAARVTINPSVLTAKTHHQPKAVPAPPPKPEPKPVEVPREEREAALKAWQEKTQTPEDKKEVRAVRPLEIDKFSTEKAAIPTTGKQKAPVRRPQPNDRTTRRPGGRSDHTKERSRRFDPAAMERLQQNRQVQPEVDGDRTIEITLPIAVKDLSAKLGIKVSDLQRKLIELDMFVTINDPLPQDVIQLLASEYKKEVIFKQAKGLEDVIVDETVDAEADLQWRAPVVTIMGHVDHGKTSLLDRIRTANVAASESGGITQHIGAYSVTTGSGRKVVFLDTPGHEAFTAMRARGANVTDVVVLVVAADDGVMPQTEEAINHAKAAEVPIIVALNKCDKPEASPERVMNQLASLGLIPEKWSGNTGYVEVSALTGMGVDKLLERILLESEILELKANPNRTATGAVLEAYLTEGKGVTAHVLIESGTLRRGQIVLCGTAYGRVRNLYDEHGIQLDQAGPSTPVEITGLSAVPEAGERVHVLQDMSRARMIAEERERKLRETALLERKHVSLENIFHRISEGQIKEIRVILKADVKGSAEVLVNSLRTVGTKEVSCRVIHSAVGNVNESDVLLADASDAIVIGFNVAVESRARSIAQEKGVDVRTHDVIYHMIEEMKAALQGLLEPEEVEVVQGKVAVKELFNISRIGVIAGCLVTSGKIERSSRVRQFRDGTKVYDGKLSSLKRFKDDVREVAEGFECGIKLEGRDDLKPGDLLEAYEVKLIPRKL